MQQLDMGATSASLPIISHFAPKPEPREVDAAVRLARAIERDHPEFRVPDELRSLVPTRLEDAPTLHLDDLSAIPHLDAGADVRFYQERARLRAVDGDIVATSLPVADGYEDYCRRQLGLGSVRWVHPHPSRVPIRLAEACWEDEVVQTELVCRARAGDLQYVHPHMGTLPVWELAALLRDQSHREMKVVAPLPALTEWVNNKIAFTDLVRQLFGDRFVPRTMSAGNFATLADHVKELATSCTTIAIKLADSAGGDGTVIFDAGRFRTQSLGPIREVLRRSLETLEWDGRTELLVDCWETQIACSPSVQLWIPPRQSAEPIVEGLFAQVFEGETGVFVGSAPADLPDNRSQEIVNRVWLLAKVLQQLGYLGRCSFDTILVGDTIENARLEFVECNGRWGGTSSPMTLMNRIFGDWSRRPFVSRVCNVHGLDSLSFRQVMEAMGNELYDRGTGLGNLIVTLPGRITARSAIDLIALGADIAAARYFMNSIALPRLRELVVD
jgi:hypothetical protein